MCAAQSNRRKLWANFLEKGKSAHSRGGIARAKVIESKVNVAPFRGKILGIDPSLRGTGLAVLNVKNRDEMDLIFSQTVKVPSKESLLTCTRRIFEAISEVVEHFQPTICAVEQTIYVQNFQTAQIMGIARGAVLTATAIHCLPAFEYAPLRIKQAICGYGRASKEQISKMIQAILKIPMNVSFDETDAAAVALCCFFTEHSLAEIVSRNHGNSSFDKT
ncbi:MAG: crossover junction endodeoxyribonuclease RuvC [Puniceicoccales bacterium]|jgi:crossover junction endodeoxyribonuclease RuvC|nr:crossover junction endodeoxyribonuclease RuvC [Puniceicoccales bacterium]